MRDLIAQARLQHGKASRHPDGAAIAVGKANHAAAPLVKGAEATRDQNHNEQAEIADDEAARDVFERIGLGRRAHLCRREIGRAPLGVSAFFHDGAAALVEAEQSERRHQHGCGQQKRGGISEERLHSQPEVKADTAVDPGDDQNRQRHPHPVRCRRPIAVKYLRIELGGPEQREAEPRADDMRGNQRRNAQAEHELQRFDRLPAELPPLVKRPDSEAAMDQHRAVKHDRDRQELPEQEMVVQAPGQRLQRNIAERMVEEMADQIGEEDQPADHADLPDADASQEFSDLGLGWFAHVGLLIHRPAKLAFYSTSAHFPKFVLPSQHPPPRTSESHGHQKAY